MTSGTRYRVQSIIPAEAEDDSPTQPAASVTEMWKEAADHMARKLVDVARIKRRCGDVLDAEGAERALLLAREMQQISRVLANLPGISPELSATVRRACVDRLTGVHPEVDRLLDLDVARRMREGWVG